MNEIEDTIEKLIDEHGLVSFLESLSTVCTGKAVHLSSNWQDTLSARPWDKAARKIGQIGEIAKLEGLR